ncbi:cytochrome c oxidase assembly protein [Rhodopila globiformis]|uniref:cytochrome c oxidase assembly protein n=1 Tax=Rhodopila globiformis TaxID=1071 RepID=UPI001304E8D6|nr:cytochrome c oxidase assembly protein [Rhodopila globiformis]
MNEPLSTAPAAIPAKFDPLLVMTGLVLAVGTVLWWGDAVHPAEMPVFAPWDFSWIEYLGIALPLLWYLRGLTLTPAAERPHGLRQTAFLAGVALIWVTLQTHFVYLSQHMFFLNRLQHMGMHHLGPFLIALAWPGETLARGMPAAGLRLARARPIGAMLRVVQNPVVAGLLFVGLIWFWLIPNVHFHAMISPVLYTTMNLSMVIDGLLFWFFILDPRPAPPARHSYAVRLVTCILVIFPQLLLGAHLTFAMTPLYSYYDLCGRLFPSVSALLDQHLGGVIVWIPSSMMSSVAFMLMLNNIRLHEDRQNGGNNNDDIEIAPGVRISSRAWTGR